jgi:preprotein translocase subunit SecE
MAMNREQKRMLQRQGQLGPDGEQVGPASRDAQQRRAAAARAPRVRAGPAQFTREVRAELRKVAWPSREETIRLSGIVLFALVVLTAFIFGIDYLSAKGVFFLFDQ